MGRQHPGAAGRRLGSGTSSVGAANGSSVASGSRAPLIRSACVQGFGTAFVEWGDLQGCVLTAVVVRLRTYVQWSQYVVVVVVVVRT